ncbi:aldehyde dehydrogenase family protein [Streptomyces virginiae]|uniref:aldehyde dehydrogenase family protein n=1 Tax=Streptomyces virginiae TaxID=1961 RepID=UPI002252D7A5|nr:aldehyde dehydrogenase family protein [Streptomyces virginiae]MCX4960124.1 aldehyde dehydrogenase family protein [Streptomyces virginiae]
MPTARTDLEATGFTSRDPVDDRVVATFPTDDEATVRHKTDRARDAARWWDALGHDGRRTRLLAWKRVMTRRRAEIIDLLGRENGKVRADAVIELSVTLAHVDWAARNAHRVLRRRKMPSGLLMFNQASTLEYKPYGVIGVIGPWNYPVFTPIGSLAYALAAGNAVVFKPSEHTPACGKWLTDTFAEAVPEHPVLQLTTGAGPTGAALCTSGVDKIAFTGSRATGARVLAACAPSVTPVLLELGGKDALVVAADADVEAAVEAALWGGCANAGQSCTGIERVYVAEVVHEHFLNRLTHRARQIHARQDFGPITMPGQLDIIRRHVQDALDRGGRALVGGPDSIRPPYVLGPIVLADVPEDSAALREETFGPVLVVNRVRDAAEGVRRANDSPYGLGAALFARRGTTDLARSIRSGMVSVNDVMAFPGVPSLPFGGVGASGFGRIHGADGLREFTVPHAVTRRRFPAPLAVSTYARGARDIAGLERVVRLLGAR